MKKLSVDPVEEKLPEVIGTQRRKHTKRRQGQMLGQEDIHLRIRVSAFIGSKSALTHMFPHFVGS